MVLCTVCYSKFAVAWNYTAGSFPNNINCGTSNYGTDDSLGNGPWSNTDPEVYRLVNAQSSANENFINLDFQTDTVENPSGGTCNYKKCRIKKEGNNANKCGANGAYHAERMSCASSVPGINNTGASQLSDYDGQPFRPVSNNRPCIDFPFGPIIKNASNVDKANLNKKGTITLSPSITPSASSYTWTYNNNVNFIFTKDDIQNNGTCEYNKGSGNVLTCLSYVGWSVSNFTMKKTFSNNDSLHCSSGYVVWTAETTAGGNAASGFYAIFKESSTNPKLTCSTCYTGWKSNSAQTACESCDDTKNFAGSGGFCGCKKGYYYNGSTCVRDTSGVFSEVLDPYSNGGYYCAQGYTVTLPMPIPSAENNYVRYVCGCNTANGFIEDTEGCHCQTGYTINDMGDNNPENDTCVINTTTTYNDSTGWFTVGPNGSSCNTSGYWWEQQN